MKSSFTGRVILIYGGLLLVVISMTFLFSYMGTVRGLRSQLKETNFALLNQINQKLELSFKQTEKDLLQLTNELEFVYFMNNVYKDDAQRYANFYGLDSKLGTFMNRNLQFSSIYVYSHVSGDILTQQNYISNDGTEDQWLTQYLNMDGYFKWYAYTPDFRRHGLGGCGHLDPLLSGIKQAGLPHRAAGSKYEGKCALPDDSGYLPGWKQGANLRY